MEEAVRRSRQRLLWHYLSTHGYQPALEAPPPAIDLNEYGTVVPTRPLSELASLKLRVAYEIAHRGYLERGQLRDSAEVIREACAKPPRRKDARRFSELLLIHPV